MNNRTTIKSFIILVIAALMLTACGSPKVSDDHLRYGQKALSIVDDYLNFNINAKEAYNKMFELTMRSYDLPDETGTENFHNNLEVESSSRSMSLCLSSLNLSIDVEDNLQELKKQRNRLAEAIGEDLIEVSEADSQ